MDKVRTVLAWARTHKAVVMAGAVFATGLAARFVPGFPTEEVLRGLAALLAA